MRRQQTGEYEHAQEHQQCGEDVGGQIDAGLPDQHSAASPASSLEGATDARMASLSAIAARMVSTGVPEKDAIENATSCLLAPSSNWLSSPLLSVGCSQ